MLTDRTQQRINDIGLARLKSYVYMPCHLLTKREQKILAARFFGDMELQEIGDECKLTDGRISQIISTCLDLIEEDIAIKKETERVVISKEEKETFNPVRGVKMSMLRLLVSVCGIADGVLEMTICWNDKLWSKAGRKSLWAVTKYARARDLR